MTAKKLGKKQLRLLAAMRVHDGEWCPGCGWVHGNDSATDAVLASLVKHGLVERYGETAYGYGRYRLTDLSATREPHR